MVWSEYDTIRFAPSSRPHSLLENGKREKEFFTVKEVAEVIGTSDKSVRRLHQRGFVKSKAHQVEHRRARSTT